MKLWIPMLLAATAALGAAQKGHNPPPAQQQSAATESYVSFGISLFEQLAAADPDGNVIVSPVSAGLALSMVANGAEGGSLASMLAALGGAPDVAALNRGNQALMEAMRSDDLELAVANSLWARAGVPFLPSYLNATRDSYAARVEALDFDDPAAAARINDWVSENTRGRITEMVEPPLPGDLVLYLANAVYFKGDWKDQFLTAATRERTFHAPSGPRQHPLMHRTGSFRYLQGDGFSAARLPYEGDRFAMYLLLPDSGRSLADLRAKLDAANWERWMGELRPGYWNSRSRASRWRPPQGSYPPSAPWEWERSSTHTRPARPDGGDCLAGRPAPARQRRPTEGLHPGRRGGDGGGGGHRHFHQRDLRPTSPDTLRRGSPLPLRDPRRSDGSVALSGSGDGGGGQLAPLVILSGAKAPAPGLPWPGCGSSWPLVSLSPPAAPAPPFCPPPVQRDNEQNP
jgi:hypothetical protein